MLMMLLMTVMMMTTVSEESRSSTGMSLFGSFHSGLQRSRSVRLAMSQQLELLLCQRV